MLIQNCKVIACQDLDELVEKTYERPYNFQQQDDCQGRGVVKITIPCDKPYDYGNDCVEEVVNSNQMGVSFKAWLARDPAQPLRDPSDPDERCDKWEIRLWWERNFYPSLDMVVNDLHAKGLIPAGGYVIVIDW